MPDLRSLVFHILCYIVQYFYFLAWRGSGSFLASLRLPFQEEPYIQLS